ncbi:cyclodeaminase/cyclohydrolase family protein [Deinococcus murrayi]|uniref:cyclodeaminase/cyclohydrolase family protein n=1 Tax=Deinococcus murrayi TaxID=68910 RepID=UPI0005550725|nr:cyclodeaminase/cyclohydrolase family protein [Deinococcus murrayi]
MAQFWDETARDLLARTASGDPTPGGGAAGAVSAAFGVALMEMALHIALERSWREEAHPPRRALLSWLAGQRERLQTLGQADARAFGRFVEAARSPGETPEQAAEREAALEDAARRAAGVPLDLAQTGVRVLERAAEALAPALVVSDVGAGAGLLAGAADAARVTVEANLSRLPDAEAQALREESAALARRARELAGGVLGEALRRLGERGDG